MNRRVGLTIAVALVLACPAALAQAEKVFRVGYLVGVTPLAEISGADPQHPVTRGFVRELRALGYEEGRNLVLERRSAEGRPERYADIIADLLKLEPDVLVVPGVLPLVDAARRATSGVPIVSYSLIDPVERGWAASLAHPGGNITGVAIVTGAENEGKRMELLKEAIPGASRVVYLVPNTRQPLMERTVAQAARSLGIELVRVVHEPASFERAKAEILRQRADALFASLSSTTYGQREQIVAFALQARLAGSYPYGEMAAAGGLMSYGVDVADLGRKAAHYVDRILKGAKPGDVPIDRPTKFELIVNLKTARALGLAIPRSLLLRADRVIE